MKSLQTDSLNLEVHESNGKAIMLWKGKSRYMNPEALLTPYFEEILNELTGIELIIDFSDLETMNSSTILPILSFIRNLEEHKVKTEVKYDGDLRWQRASFNPIGTIIKSYKYVKVNAI